MIDIHCHILPYIDDGAKHMEESIEMARAAISEGIHTIIATPHHWNGACYNPKRDVLKAVKTLNERLETEEIPVTILPGQETRINGEMLEALKREELLPLNETSGYLFVELPSSHVPRYTKQLMFDLQLQGIKPIIVHPERNKEIIENPDLLFEIVRDGTLTQLTAGSIAGRFGKKIKKFSIQLIEANLAHFIASDAHNVNTRPFAMQEAFKVISNEFGTSYLYWFMENSQLILNEELVVGDIPEKVTTKKFLGLF